MSRRLIGTFINLFLPAVVYVFLFPMTFLFAYAWNHSIHELWPLAVPFIHYWQAYLLLIVVSFLVPVKVIGVVGGTDR